MARGKEAGRRWTQRVSLLDSAPSDSSDDSEPVLTRLPSRLGGTAFGDFGGNSCCTFHSGFRRSSEDLPGYSLLPHLYQDAQTIALARPSVKFCERKPRHENVKLSRGRGNLEIGGRLEIEAGRLEIEGWRREIESWRLKFLNLKFQI